MVTQPGTTLWRVALLFVCGALAAATRPAYPQEVIPPGDLPRCQGDIACGFGDCGFPLPPPAPANLTVSTVPPGLPRLSWTWVPDTNAETTFIIQRQIGSQAFQEIGRVDRSQVAYVDAGVFHGVTYTYRVQAYREHFVNAVARQRCWSRYTNAASWSSDLAFLVTNGSALQLPGSVLRLTSSAPDQVGSVWLTTRQRVVNGFRCRFAFRISGLGGGGADGLAFVVQNAGVSALGRGGGGLGYEGIPNSLAVEFDTWQNSDLGDTSDNHISVHTLGTQPNSADARSLRKSTTSTAIPNLSDGAIHRVSILYLKGIFRIDVDNSVAPVLSVPVDLSGTLRLDDGSAFVGFTAATGGAFETHEILGWEFE
jgi:hypothetical protein